jgi:hypothetical protein|nr:MAG TPA: hypothetical protein [Caudoviricetes sp.]
MSTLFTIADMMEYNSYHRLPYQERLDYLRNNWSVTIEPEIFDSYRGIGRWVWYSDGSGWFEARIPYEMLQDIVYDKDKYGGPIYREEDCRALIVKHGL